MSSEEEHGDCTKCGANLDDFADDRTFTCAICENNFCQTCFEENGKMSLDINPPIEDMDDDDWVCDLCLTDHYKKNMNHKKI